MITGLVAEGAGFVSPSDLPSRGAAVVFGVHALAGPRTAIRESGAAIVFGLGALAGPCPAIRKSGAAIVFGLRASAGPRPVPRTI